MNDDMLREILAYVKQNNAILKQNNQMLRCIKQMLEKEFSTENVLKVESIIFLASIFSNIIGNYIYDEFKEDDNKKD